MNLEISLRPPAWKKVSQPSWWNLVMFLNFRHVPGVTVSHAFCRFPNANLPTADPFASKKSAKPTVSFAHFLPALNRDSTCFVSRFCGFCEPMLCKWPQIEFSKGQSLKMPGACSADTDDGVRRLEVI